jgi:hypothetical protein
MNWIDNPPLLIYGPRKSGTTLLQNLLDGGDQLLVFPTEMKLKYLKDVFWENDIKKALQIFNKLSPIEHILGLDIQGYNKSIFSPQFSAAVGLRELIYNCIRAVFNNIDSKPNNIKLWAIKEVGGDTCQIVKLWRQMFIQGKVLMIVRKPLMVTRSVLRNRRKIGQKLNFFEIFKQVKDPYRVLTDQIKWINDPSFCFICYEDLTVNPHDTMRYVSEYLDISYESKFTTPTIFTNPVIVKTSSRETKEVFTEKRNWYSDLTKKEILYIVISLSLLYCQNIVRPIHKRINFSKYSVLKKLIFSSHS